MSGLSFGQLSKLLCLFDSKSSDFSSWVDLRNDSLSPSIPSSFEFRWSCRFEDARGKLSALRTFRHNFDVEPCRLKNSWKFQRNRIAGRVGNVVPRAFVKPLFRTRSERKNALLFFFFFFLFSLAKILGARYSKKNVNFLSSFSPFRSFRSFLSFALDERDEFITPNAYLSTDTDPTSECMRARRAWKIRGL